LVTRAVGVEDTVLLETHLHETQAGDVYLMCSDGLSDMLSDSSIASLLRANDSLSVAGQSLINSANEAGGRDNISVILVRVSGTSSILPRQWWRFRR
jgi:protein phosphatase